MADFSTIIQEINEEIKQNGANEITGAKLNEVLRDMIDAVNAKKQDPLTIDATPTEDSNNPVQSGGVYEALGSLYRALSVAENCLFGGLVTSLESPSQGDDHRYYYITQQGGYFSHFDVTIPDDTPMAVMIYWSNILSRWVTIGLWPTMTYVDAKANKVSDATQGHLAGLDSDGNPTDSGIPASDVATTSDLAGKQNTITDLADIRSGAAAGATAYQKPSGGIPKTDLSSGVQTSLGKADTALQTETDPVFLASPAAGITAGDIADWNGKADSIPVVDASTIPASMEPNKLYKYGTLSGDTVFPPLATPTDQSRANVYWWKFTTPASTINVQMPSAITIWNGGQPPTIDPSTTYEITVEDGFGTCIKS